MKHLRNMILILMPICCMMLSQTACTPQSTPSSNLCKIGQLTVTIPSGWYAFNDEETRLAKADFFKDISPSLAQYSRTGEPDPKLGDFEIYQNQPNGQLIGWTLIVPNQTDMLQEIFKTEQKNLDQKSIEGQIENSSCSLYKIGEHEVVRVDVEQNNGAKSTNIHYWSPKSPGLISTLMFGLRPGASEEVVVEYNNMITTLVVTE